ncbi:hypothetical protein ACI6PS_05150 [Flavobacterium sp. PLA-1-15]|uniref:hypothetical protein n=1 Tax=Flavobacterium sp. PLA-1-15 TaxID=3380533 RepID=UPI003B76CB19
MKQLLSFFVFLLLGCVKLSASTVNDFETIETTETVTPEVINNDAPHALLIPQDFIFTSVHITLEQESKNIFTTDNEKAEEEVPTSVKKPTNGAFVLANPHFLKQFVGSDDSSIKQFQPRNYFVYFPSNTIQILFCTFRI